ncbi:hypothetical protein [Neobacillus dielmonensis]|uniref:hypothetical protein n=1 Tax=Neobacillus dielmonensis TaxID=1347369 RepID=UPI0005A74791|nr:hypothetical protein [Neobacillus dielmonensis]
MSREGRKEIKESSFHIEYTKDMNISYLSHKDDPHQMNWVEGTQYWGTVKAPEGIAIKVSRTITERATLREVYEFTNHTGFDIFSKVGDTSIYTTFNDDYESAEICTVKKCHAHIWCGGEVSYVMGLRMGGEGPHLGLILTKGSITSYSVERNLSLISNDRGDFLLHIAPFDLAPGETYRLEWELFWHEGKQDFYKKLQTYPTYIQIQAEQYTVFEKEEVQLEIIFHPGLGNPVIHVLREGRPIHYLKENNSIIVKEGNLVAGEYVYSISIGGVTTETKILVLPDIKKLTASRCKFIVNNQQYHKPGSPLDGAYLIYDNEEHRSYYSHRNDHNGGRERVGMGVLLARFLRENENEQMEKSLKKYINYIRRELYDEETGVVFNDIHRNNDWHRLYNYSWFAVLFKELYLTWKNKGFLQDMSKILLAYYRHGGNNFYPIELQMFEILQLLEEAGLTKEKKEIFNHFEEHIQTIIGYGIDYPKSEVNFEQSIVAPAAFLLLEMYKLTDNPRYLEEARKHVKLLDLFNGLQPDYHLFENAIRHWDGYWFGKNKLYGDTFPHYWSALTGRVFQNLAEVTKDLEYAKKAESSFRGVLNLFSPDGSASCAKLTPFTVNGVKAGFYDPWANDQDWGLYFMYNYIS